MPQKKPVMNMHMLRFDRTAPIADRRITIENVNVVNLPVNAGIDGLLSGAFDAADIPWVRYVSWKHEGRRLTAIPVFSDRFFQHEYIYTRVDTGIASLADLRGRRVVCAPSYFATPSFWHRALLREEAGIRPEEIEWHTPILPAEGMSHPKGVTIKVSSASILGLERVLDGTADALMTARTPFVPKGHEGKVRRVLSDAADRQKAWYVRSGYFPALHVIAIREESLKARPSFAVELCQAFDRAKQYYYNVLQDERMTGLPFMRSYLDDAMAISGNDPWPYGIERNRREIDRFVELAQADGMIDRRLSVEELFDESAAAYDFASRMEPGCITGTLDTGWAPNTVWPE